MRVRARARAEPPWPDSLTHEALECPVQPRCSSGTRREPVQTRGERAPHRNGDSNPEPSCTTDNFRVFLTENVENVNFKHRAKFCADTGTELTLVPIWFPHWPAWMCTISRIFLLQRRCSESEWRERASTFICSSEARSRGRAPTGGCASNQEGPTDPSDLDQSPARANYSHVSRGADQLIDQKETFFGSN